MCAALSICPKVLHQLTPAPLSVDVRVLAKAKVLHTNTRRNSIEVELEHKTEIVEYRIIDNDVIVSGRRVLHKFTEPIKVSFECHA
jgi:hypothetical protein